MEIANLNDNKEAIEERARNILCMIKQEESSYRLLLKNSKNKK
ncbi:septum formation initiator family protein [secondary endosymbiont of Heteropsylla cubana]|nr:septum formation initiator family protein [secondary endosymbiont of Heteropsylla cubana]